MPDSINCEPYGYIKYSPDDVDTIIDEVEDIKHSTEDLNLTIPTNLILNKFKNMILHKHICDVVGHISKHNNDTVEFMDYITF